MKVLKKLFFGGITCGVVFGLILFWVYGVDSRHKSRSSIWWPERGRNLIPPTATDIVLRRDLLHHYATYTVPEKDLHAFFLGRFAASNARIDPAKDGRLVNNADVDQVGPLAWDVTAGTLKYAYSATNGGLHTYYHDPSTGRTYQSSAYW